MIIPAGQTQVSQEVPIIQDDEAEGSEQFQAQLTIPSASTNLGVTAGDDDTAVITIMMMVFWSSSAQPKVQIDLWLSCLQRDLDVH